MIFSLNHLKIIEFNNIVDLENYEYEWDNLFANHPGGTPTQTFAWTCSYLKNKLKKETKWFCMFAFDKQKLVGVYPFIILKNIRIPGIIFQYLQNPFNAFHTIFSDGLILPGYEMVLHLFIQYIQKTHKVYPIFRINCIPDDSTSIRALKQINIKLKYFQIHKGYCNSIILPDNYQSYLSGLKSKFIKDINRKVKRLNQEHKITFSFNTKNKTNKEFFELFTEVECSGWKGTKGTSIKQISGDADLFLDATNKFYTQNILEWNFLKANNQPIAAQLNLNIKEVVYIWKIGYREEFSNFSPSNVLLFKLIEMCYENGGIKEINFMGDCCWQIPWNISKRKVIDLVIFPEKFPISWIVNLFYTIKIRYKLKISRYK